MCTYARMKVPKMIIASVRQANNNELCCAYIPLRGGDEEEEEEGVDILHSERKRVSSRTCSHGARRTLAAVRSPASMCALIPHLLMFAVHSRLARSIKKTCITISDTMHGEYLIGACRRRPSCEDETRYSRDVVMERDGFLHGAITRRKRACMHTEAKCSRHEHFFLSLSLSLALARDFSFAIPSLLEKDDHHYPY